ncbi:hypothetical protein CD30_16335 [Ureibacillus massiliensis 4400831 = CIP 108448 = CCUG 49529]|uniref:Replication-associated protein ORF2/G2P domain-containing protein n=1 Tax=Ureibacillus massiliensis 4400831 = CIP 108448 = CCUG 49529 TaxID=1211035 RepID=A0A0A3JRB9_9BACL|nr:hypothetical protein [Ureibacillus massiliensis]KGR89567.1 hypothetical protein CD30_16335 [Ureibacillus massiliensis 4400831 = CIP 108448 = CCUG 49529]
MSTLEVTVTHTESVSTVIERYLSQPTYNRKGGRKRKGQELHVLNQCEQAEESKRCSIQNSKRTFKGIIYANFAHSFSMLTLTFRPCCDFDTKDFIICRDKFNLFWKSLKRCKQLKSVDLRYVGAIEFQKNGRIHFHILCRIPKQFKKLVSSKWKHGGLHFKCSIGDALDAPNIANYLNKDIHDDRLPLGKKRFLGGRGLDRPVVMKFTSRKIIDFLLQRNGAVLHQFESKHGFTYTALLSDATIDELEAFAEAENEDLILDMLEKLESISQNYN